MKNLIIITLLLVSVENKLQAQNEIQTETILNELQKQDEMLDISCLIDDKMIFVNKDGDIVASIGKTEFENGEKSKDNLNLWKHASFMFESLGNTFYLVEMTQPVSTPL